MASGCYPLVKMLDDYFVSIGLVRKEGNIVDATFLRANSRPTKHEDKKTDIDAEFGRRGDIRRLRKCLSIIFSLVILSDQREREDLY